MGNLKKWGGPMPQSFLQQQHALQLRILPRLQALGIIGVLPGFAGFVPVTTTTISLFVRLVHLKLSSQIIKFWWWAGRVEVCVARRCDLRRGAVDDRPLSRRCV